MQPVGFQRLLRQAQGGDRGAMDKVLEILHPHIEPRSLGDNQEPESVAVRDSAGKMLRWLDASPEREESRNPENP